MEIIIVAVLALAVGLLAGWLVAARRAGGMASDLAVATMRAADAEVARRAHDEVERERNEAHRELAAIRAEAAERQRAHTVTLDELKTAREAMTAQFGAAAAKALENAQTQFLDRAQQRLSETETMQGQRLAALLQPVSDRLQRYEEGVAKVEAERRDAFGLLHGQIEALRTGQERVSGEAAKLVNALRNAPKARGRWGEQQLRNVLESCGLSEHADFRTEVSVDDGEGGRLRPDVIVRIPGGKTLVIDSKVSLNAYQDAFGSTDDSERKSSLEAHALSMRAHVNGLSNKAYWSQFEETPDYVIMFVPGEHFLSAALENDSNLWDFAFEKRVLLATPTNLVAIARTVAAVWRQEKLAKDAREIGLLGKELYDRLAKALGDLKSVGGGLNTAVKNYNTFVSSFETRALVSARKLREYNIEIGNREIDTVAPVEVLAGHALLDGDTAESETPVSKL